LVWKETVLTDYDEAGISDSATIEVVKLPQALISAIHIRLSGTGGSGTIALDTDPTLITRVKIKTSKGYVVDATGTQLRTLARKITGTIPKVGNNTDAYSELVIPIYSGRKVKDKALMLDILNDVVRQMEISFGTLIATTAFATGTVRLSINIVEWIGDKPKQYKGYLGFKEVEDKATGTGKATFELFQGNKLAGLLIEVVTITTVRQVTVSDKKESIQFAKANWRDILNKDNSENDKETAETTWAHWEFYDEGEELEALPDLSKVSDPVCTIERGTTTTVTGVIQQELYE